jgi:hypothetical protein
MIKLNFIERITRAILVRVVLPIINAMYRNGLSKNCVYTWLNRMYHGFAERMVKKYI